MIRAAATGVIDFTQFDPTSAWWWKRMYMLLGELVAQQHREINLAVHTHWVTLASHSRLSPESFTSTQQHANNALQTLLDSYYPWLENQKTGDPNKVLMDAFRQQYGYPGDPRYEKMLAEAAAALRPKSTAEKLAARLRKD